MIKSVKLSSSPLETIKIILIFSYWYAVNFFIRITKSILFKKAHHAKKILIFRNGSIGDCICAFPAINQIRNNFPNAEIDIMSNAGSKNLVSLNKLLNQNLYKNFIDYFDISRSDLIKQLKYQNYDLVIQLPQTQASIISLIRDMIFFRFIINIPCGFGWEYSTIKFWRRTQEKFISYYGEIERLINILKKNALIINNELDFPFNITQTDIELVSRDIAILREKHELPFISIIIGAKRPQNRWPIEYFKKVIAHFCNSHNILIIGGKDDIEPADSLIDLPNVYNLCGKYTPLQSGLVISHCSLSISNDTGPMHLSYAFNVPVVCIFSSRDFPYKWFPPQQRKHIILRNNNISCSLCLSENCTNNICMQGIPPEGVINAAESLLY